VKTETRPKRAYNVVGEVARRVQVKPFLRLQDVSERFTRGLFAFVSPTPSGWIRLFAALIPLHVVISRAVHVWPRGDPCTLACVEGVVILSLVVVTFSLSRWHLHRHSPSPLHRLCLYARLFFFRALSLENVHVHARTDVLPAATHSSWLPVTAATADTVIMCTPRPPRKCCPARYRS
jgi:hypothetical protein